MRRTKTRNIIAAVAALALMVSAGTAIAASGKGGLKEAAARIADRSSFDAAVASNLGTTAAKVKAAVKAAAVAQIDAALAADEITAAEAATLKEALADGGRLMRIATAADVAKELGTTEAKLNAAYSSARKAQATARVDQALEDGKITEAYATELKTEIADATFPGFGAGGHGKHGGKGRGGFGGGKGFGLPSGADRSDSGSSSTAPTAYAFS